MRYNAIPQLLVGEAGECVCGAADLEGTDLLQVLGLEEEGYGRGGG